MQSCSGRHDYFPSTIPSVSGKQRHHFLSGWRSVSKSRVRSLWLYSRIRFFEQGKVRLPNPIKGGTGIADNDTHVLIVERPTGNMTIVDGAQQDNDQFGLDQPHVVHALAENDDQVYLLSGDSVFKTDIGGHIVQSYWLRSGHLFVGRSIRGHRAGDIRDGPRGSNGNIPVPSWSSRKRAVIDAP